MSSTERSSQIAEQSVEELPLESVEQLVEQSVERSVEQSVERSAYPYSSLDIPPLITDGRHDSLTGLDAPDIFYNFLERAIARKKRNSQELLALIRFRINLAWRDVTESASNDAIRNIEFEVVELSAFLQRHSRTEENLTRIGQVTFLLLARCTSKDELSAMVHRLQAALSDFEDRRSSKREAVDKSALGEVDSGIVDTGILNLEEVKSGEVKSEIARVEAFERRIGCDVFLHESDEDMLHFLQRAGV